MATGFHESTVAMSVRNYLAVAGRSSVAAIVRKLQALWLPTVDRHEVMGALEELIRRGYVRVKGSNYEATSPLLVRRAKRPKFTDKDRDKQAWEWQLWRPAPHAFLLDQTRLNIGRPHVHKG